MIYIMKANILLPTKLSDPAQWVGLLLGPQII